jgi:hypothetical protein
VFSKGGSTSFSGGFAVKLGLIDVSDADLGLNDNRWIVMGYDGGFAQYLEQCYFELMAVKTRSKPF